MQGKPETVTKEKQIEIYAEKIPAALLDFYAQLLPDQNQNENTVIEQYITEQPQNRFNAALMYICKTVFKDRKPLFFQAYKTSIPGYENSISHVYDADIVTALLEIYIYLCHRYDKDVSVYGFSLLTGINTDTIYNWNSSYKNRPFNNDSLENVSSKHSDVFKILSSARQESLTGMLTSGRRNPVGIIAALNHLYGWNDAGRPTEQASPAALTADFLPRLDSISSIPRPELPAADNTETL